jgi:hypothetical protein
MKKQNEQTPEEIARDLENVDFADISEEDLKEVFGGDRTGGGIDQPIGSTNCNCIC